MKPHNLSLRFLSLCFLTLLITACAPNQVDRVDSGEESALTDKWNAKDSELVADAMIEDMLSFPWVARHNDRYNQRPTISVQRIGNESHQQIPVDTFVNDLKRAVIRSGIADFAASRQERGSVREERQENQANIIEGTGAQSGQEIGTNYALSGSINSFVDAAGDYRVTSYQVDLKLIDMQTNLEVWNGQKKIQKRLRKKLLGVF